MSLQHKQKKSHLSTRLNISVSLKDSLKDCAEDYMALLCNVLTTITGTKSQGNQIAGMFVKPREANNWDIHKVKKINSWDIYKRI